MDTYLRFWGLVSYSVTAWLFFVKEVCLVDAVETRPLNFIL